MLYYSFHLQFRKEFFFCVCMYSSTSGLLYSTVMRLLYPTLLYSTLTRSPRSLPSFIQI